ncbi:6055_t:CDS:2 [Funneliformis geosporum]|nr:6055_t:CDS:2 [Funneliformis geosporum]
MTHRKRYIRTYNCGVYKKFPNRIKNNINNLFNDATKDYVLQQSFQVSKFCDHFLHKLESTEEQMPTIFERTQYAFNVVENKLQAMEAGSKKQPRCFQDCFKLLKKI